MESSHRIKDVRLLGDIESAKRKHDVCDLRPESVKGMNTAKTGWHRGYYQNFTKNLNPLKSAVESSHPASPEPFQHLHLHTHSQTRKRARALKRSWQKLPFHFLPNKCQSTLSLPPVCIFLFIFNFVLKFYINLYND